MLCVKHSQQRECVGSRIPAGDSCPAESLLCVCVCVFDEKFVLLQILLEKCASFGKGRLLFLSQHNSSLTFQKDTSLFGDQISIDISHVNTFPFEIISPSFR